MDTGEDVLRPLTNHHRAPHVRRLDRARSYTRRILLTKGRTPRSWNGANRGCDLGFNPRSRQRNPVRLQAAIDSKPHLGLRYRLLIEVGHGEVDGELQVGRQRARIEEDLRLR